MAHAQQIERNGASAAAGLSLAALILFGVRFVQGFIFWGGASRRLIYDFHDVVGVDQAVKLDSTGPALSPPSSRMRCRAPCGSRRRSNGHCAIPISSSLRCGCGHSPNWRWVSGLMLGLATRLSAFASIWLNVTLMLIFGWMGSTCLDEWTMAVSGVAMSSAVFLAGGGAFSLDQRYFAPAAGASGSAWRRWIFSGPLPDATLRKLALWLGVACALFTVFSYQILFGAVVSPLHSRTNFHRHDIALSAPQVATDGSVTFDAYVDAGPDTGAAYIIAATLLDGSGQKLAQWDGAALAALTPDAVRNAYPYEWAAQFKTERIGFSGQTGARATITLPPIATGPASGDARILVLEAIDGSLWRGVGAVAK